MLRTSSVLPKREGDMMTTEEARRIKNIEVDNRHARQKVLVGFIKHLLMVLLTVDSYYCHDDVIAGFDGDAIHLYYRPPHGWRKYMKGERYCPPDENESKGGNDTDPQRGNILHDRHYLYGGD